MKKMLVILAVLSLSTGDVSWPMFMHDQQHTGAALCAAPDTAFLLWVYDVKAPIVASPVVVDDTVFLAARGKMVAVQDTGKVIWSHKIPVIGSTPAVSEKTIVVGTTSGFVALNSETGDIVWEQTIWESYLNSDYNPFEEFFTSSPLIVHDKVYAGTGTNVRPEPLLSHPQNVKELRQPLRYIICMDLESGEIVWKVDLAAYVNSSPAFYGNTVYISEAFCYALNPDNGTVLWKCELDSMSSSPVIADSTVVAASQNKYGESTVFRICEGEVLWSRELEDSISSTPAVSCGKVTVVTDRGDVSVLDLETGALLWTQSLGATYLIKDWFILSASASPALADGKVFVGTASGVFSCLDLETGEVLWQYQTGEALLASPAVVDEKVFVGSTDGKLYCFGIDPETYYEKARKYEEQGDTDRATEFYVRAKDYYQEKGDLDMVKKCTYELEGRRYFWVGFIVFCIIGAFLIYRKMSS